MATVDFEWVRVRHYPAVAKATPSVHKDFSTKKKEKEKKAYRLLRPVSSARSSKYQRPYHLSKQL
jgi:hypothetical protein